jgi:amino acid transporter
MGPIGGSIFAFMVAFSCFGALNGKSRSHCSHGCAEAVTQGSFFTSARLIYSASRERYLPAVFGQLHKTRKTPVNAMALQAAITLFFIALGGGFRTLINFAVVATWFFYFLTVGLSLMWPGAGAN